MVPLNKLLTHLVDPVLDGEEVGVTLGLLLVVGERGADLAPPAARGLVAGLDVVHLGLVGEDRGEGRGVIALQGVQGADLKKEAGRKKMAQLLIYFMVILYFFVLTLK